jgi:hypothetical protein
MPTPQYGIQIKHDDRTDLIEHISGIQRQRWATIRRGTHTCTRLTGPVLGWGEYNSLYKVVGNDGVVRTYLVYEA